MRTTYNGDVEVMIEKRKWYIVPLCKEGDSEEGVIIIQEEMTTKRWRMMRMRVKMKGKRRVKIIKMKTLEPKRDLSI
jgi:hypothetical protein